MGNALVYNVSARFLIAEALSVHEHSWPYLGDGSLRIEAVMSREASLDQPLDLTTVYGVYGISVEIWRLLGLGNGNACTDMDATSIASFYLW